MSETQADRQKIQVDIACVGLGPATGGFLTTLSKGLTEQPDIQSKVMPGMPPQVICYERSDDVGFGVSGVVTRARAIKESFPQLDLSQIPTAHEVTDEKVIYLLDPVGASRRSAVLKVADTFIKALGKILPYEEYGFSLPFLPAFMKKHDGMVMSLGQFNQWVANDLMAQGLVQIWPSMPVKEPVIEDNKVVGIRLMDQGTDKQGNPDQGYMPGMDVEANLTVVGDGPVGAIGQKLDEHFGMPPGNHQHDWAVGMKMVVDLPEGSSLKPGTVFHTFGFPEPEIFGFFYVYPGNVASVGIFVPSWFKSPVRTSYRYLQHWMKHPYIWRYLKGGRMRSWGAKTLQESGKRGEPYLAGDGYARIGEGSGSTNVLTGSGVDEAWGTGALLAEGVLELLKQGRPFTKENLEKAYVARRRASWIEKDAQIAKKSRDGFHLGFVSGLIGMGLTGMTHGLINMPAKVKKPAEHIESFEKYFKGKISENEIVEIKKQAAQKGEALYDLIMNRLGWPEIEYDGQLLISHQDALLVGGKVQAPGGYQDHVSFRDTALCQRCTEKICIELCSGQAIMPAETGEVPQFDREKCVHCGACLWNCSQVNEKDQGNICFTAGAGGLHSAEN